MVSPHLTYLFLPFSLSSRGPIEPNAELGHADPVQSNMFCTMWVRFGSGHNCVCGNLPEEHLAGSGIEILGFFLVAFSQTGSSKRKPDYREVKALNDLEAELVSAAQEAEKHKTLVNSS